MLGFIEVADVIYLLYFLLWKYIKFKRRKDKMIEPIFNTNNMSSYYVPIPQQIIYHHELDEPLKLGHCIEICGTPHSSWIRYEGITIKLFQTVFLTNLDFRYAVDFKCTNVSGADIALHFNPRHDMRVIVRNSREGGLWKTEETIIPSGFHFPRDKRFSLIFFFAPKCFMIAINDTHFCTFPYRIPLQKIRFIEVNGETDVHSFDYREMQQYPKPSEAMVQMNVPTMDNFQENSHLVQ